MKLINGLARMKNYNDPLVRGGADVDGPGTARLGGA